MVLSPASGALPDAEANDTEAAELSNELLAATRERLGYCTQRGDCLVWLLPQRR